jgi:hypothetical protein
MLIIPVCSPKEASLLAPADLMMSFDAPLRHPQGFQDQGRVEGIVQADQERNAAKDAVGVRENVETPVSGGGFFNFG